MVKKPKRGYFEPSFYNQEEIRKLFEIITGTSIEVPVKLACYFGLRRSEVIGLRWDSVDFEQKTIAVNHKIVRVKIDGKLKILATDELKTKASYRDFTIADEIFEFLTQLKQKQDENRRLMGNSYIRDYDAYICVNDMGELLKPDYVSDRFGKEIDRAGLKHIRFHELRHSCGSLLLDLGYSMKAVQSYLGHANFLTTANLYARVEKNKVRDMSNGISGAISL